MSLVQAVFNCVKQNPGISGIQIQNEFVDPLVSESIQHLESTESILWKNDGYYAIKNELKSIKDSMDDALDAISKIIQDQELKECPRCHKLAQGETEIRTKFGFRRSNGKIISQSHCRQCRSKKSNLIIELPNELTNIVFHTAKQAKNMRSKINLEGIIIEKEIPRIAYSWNGPTKVCSAKLIDNYDEKIKITLWGDDVNRIKNGSRIRILNGSTSKYFGEVSVSPAYSGKLDVIYYGERERPKKFFTQKIKPEKFSNFDSISIIDEHDQEKFDYLNTKSDFEAKKQDYHF